MCELCGGRPAAHFASYYASESYGKLDKWLFICEAALTEENQGVFAKAETWKLHKDAEEHALTPLNLRFSVEIDNFLSSPFSTVDWMAQLSGSDWLDARSFFYMMNRFRAAADCYHCFGAPPEYI